MVLKLDKNEVEKWKAQTKQGYESKAIGIAVAQYLETDQEIRDCAEAMLTEANIDFTLNFVWMEKGVDKKRQLQPTLCSCQESTVGPFIDDFSCECGIHREHMHCANCGHVLSRNLEE